MTSEVTSYFWTSNESVQLCTHIHVQTNPPITWNTWQVKTHSEVSCHDMSLILEQMVGRSRTGLLPMWLLMVFRVKPTGNVCHWCYVTEIMILTQTTMFSSTSPNCECNPPSQSFISEDVFDKPLGSFTKTFWKLASCVCGKNGILWKRRVQLCLWSQNQTRKTRTRSSPNADHTLNLTRSLGQCCHSIKIKTEHKDVESWDILKCKVSTYQWFAGTYITNIYSGDWVGT